MEQKTSLMPGWRKIAALLTLTAAIGLLWYAALDAYRSSVIEQHKRELASITEVKIQRVHAWLQEKRGDSAVLRGLTFIRDALSAPSPPAATQDILRQLELVRQAYSYDSILLFDRAGRLRLAVGETTPDEIKAAGSGNADAAGPADIRISSFRPREAKAGRELMLQIDVPIPGVDSQAIAGHLVMLLPSHAAIDPLLSVNTGRMKSNDIGILERQGEELHVLNTPRFSEPARLVLKADAPNLPSAMAARGVTGLVEGSDYRGEPVLAYIGRIPDVPWLIVSKRDKAEILAPVRMVALGSGTLTVLLTIALGLSVQFFRRHQLAERTLAERMVAQQALAASEARFRKLIDNAWDLLVLFDHDMRITYVSPSVEHQLERNLLGETIASGTALVHPEDVGRVETARQSALAHPGMPQQFEHRLRGRYDHWMIVEASFTNFFYDSDIAALSYVGRDVSDRRWAELALRDSEERYRFLFKLSPDAVFLHRSGVILETNDAAVRLFRAGSEQALIGRHWRELVVPERWPLIEQRIAMLEKGQQSFLLPSEQRYLTVDAQPIDVEATGARIVVDGKPAIMSVVRDISERKRTEAALRESKARLQAIIEHAPLGIAIVNAKGRYTMVNPAQCRMLGYSETELIGKSFRDFTHSDDAGLNEEMALEMIQGRMDNFTLEKRYLRKDGQQIWVVLLVSAVRDENGALRYFIGLLQDVTERKRMEQALRESEAHYRFLFAGSPLPMWVYDVDTLSLIEVNEAAIAHFGYTREEFQAMTLRDLVIPEQVGTLETSMSLTDEDRWGSIWTGRRKDGSRFKAAVWGRSMDYTGRPARMVLAEDVTKRVEAEEALAESEARLRAIFDSAPVGIAIANADGRYLTVNQAQCRMLGYSEAELLQLTYADITHPDDVQANLDLGALLQGGEISVGSIEKRYLRKDGTSFWVLLTIGLVRTAEGEVVGSVGVAQDITERREAEARRLEYARQQRDTLVQEVHHRIKNHLQGLAGLLRQHMHEQPGLEPVLQKFAAQINAISIVHGLQGRAETGDASLRNLAAEIAAFLGGITGAPIGLICPGSACLWAVAEAEAVPVALILNELLTNALRHGTDKTRVSLSIECDEGRAKLVIRNPGRLDGLDFAGGKGLGTGLSLIRSLLPPRGVALSLGNAEDGWVETRLELAPPVLQPMPQVQVVSLR